MSFIQLKPPVPAQRSLGVINRVGVDDFPVRANHDTRGTAFLVVNSAAP